MLLLASTSAVALLVGDTEEISEAASADEKEDGLGEEKLNKELALSLVDAPPSGKGSELVLYLEAARTGTKTSSSSYSSPNFFAPLETCL